MEKKSIVISVLWIGAILEAWNGGVSNCLKAIGTWFPWDKKPKMNTERVAELFDVMNQRICDLEDNQKEKGS
jgi:hypothetical protein